MFHIAIPLIIPLYYINIIWNSKNKINKLNNRLFKLMNNYDKNEVYNTYF